MSRLTACCAATWRCRLAGTLAVPLSAAIRMPATNRGLLAGAAALAGLAVTNAILARRAERQHPPKGRFVTVDGVRLHYTDRGRGQPILLIHGNAVSGEDYDTSGLAARLLKDRKSTRLNSSHMSISYAVFCLKKKKALHGPVL